MFIFDFGRLRTLRRKRKLTQRELGNLIGYSGPNIGRWENGEVAITADALARISTALGETNFQEFFVRRAM